MKKVIVTLLSLATLGTALATPMISNAFEINIGGHRFSDRYGHRSDNVYAVFYRKHYYESWKLKDKYGSRYEAEYAKHKLEDKGYYARIERHR
jgi:hypothetical protein